MYQSGTPIPPGLRRRALTPSQRVWQWVRLIPGVAILGGTCWGAWGLLGAPAHHRPKPAESAPSEGPVPADSVASPTAEERAIAACEATSRRVALGGSVGPLDADGWVVELWLVGKDPDISPTSPALATFVPGEPGHRRLHYPQEPLLSAHPGLSATVTVDPLPLANHPPFQGAGVIITMGEGYAPIYFEDQSRQALHRMASALADATSARYAALFARCATEDRHQIGSWFRGPGVDGLASIVVGAMGLGLPAPHLPGLVLGASLTDQSRALTALSRRWARTTKSQLSLFAAGEGAMLAERPGAFLTLSFPFGDANRATRLSRMLGGFRGHSPRP